MEPMPDTAKVVKFSSANEHSKKLTPDYVLLYPEMSALLSPYQRHFLQCMGVNTETHNWTICRG